MNMQIFRHALNLMSLAVVLLGPGWLQGQSITLSGTVKEAETGEALVGAAVVVPDDGTGTYSAEAGAYELTIEPKQRASVEIEVSYTGFAKQSFRIPLTEGDLQRDIRLEPEALTAEDVVITASKGLEQKQSDVTVSIEVVKQDAIDLQATANIERVLTQVPGIDILDGQVSIRGSSGFAYGVGSRVMVMMNGLPLLTGDASTVDFRMIPVDNIARIEVVKGASSVLYGSSALGGVINIITGDPGKEPMTSVRLRGSVYDQPRFEALDWDGDASPYEASAHLFHARKLGNLDLTVQTDFIKESGYRQATEREEFRGMVLTKFQPEGIPGLSLGVNLGARIDSSGTFLYWDSYYPDTINGEVVGGALTPTQDANGARLRLGQRYTVDPFVRYLTPNGNMFWYRGRFLQNRSDNNTNQSSNNAIIYNDFLFQTTLLDRINWVSGATYTYSRVNSQDLYGGVVITPEGDSVVNDGIFSGNSLGVYTQFDAKFGRLNASLGLRLETVRIDTLERETKPLVRAGLNYELARGTNIRASAGQAFRVPSVAERYTSTAGGGILVEPNPDIRSETGFSMELGLRQGFAFKGANSKFQGYLDVAAFRMQYEDMVEFGLQDVVLTTSSGIFTSVNVANARISGLELTTLMEFEADDWFASLNGGVTYINPVDLDAVPAEQQLDLRQWPNNIVKLLIDIQNPEVVDQPETLKYRTRWTVRASGTLGYKKASLTTNLRSRSFMESIDQFLYLVVDDLNDFRMRNPNGSRVVDFILAYQLGQQSRLALNVNNAFNEEYLVIPGFLAPQRNFSLQYQIKF